MTREYRSRIYENYATNFQKAPKSFDDASAWRWGRAYRYYLRDWLPINEDAHIVDLACGRGDFLFFFKSLGYQNITGVDISPEQVKLAGQVTSKVEIVNILEWLTGHREKFDLVTGLDIIEHFYKDEVIQFLDGCFNALKPGGRLVLQTLNGESPWGSMHRYNDITHELGFTPNVLSRLLKMHGFQVVEAREQGPIPRGHSAKSSIRYLIWQSIRFGLKIWNLAEMGNTGSGIYTRIFLISAMKKSDY